MKKLDWYIISRFLKTYFFIQLIFLGAIVVFDISEKIDDFIKNDAPADKIITQYYFNFLFLFASLFSSLFVCFSAIFFTGTLARNSEIVAMLASGISFGRLTRPYLITAVLLTGLSLWVNNYLVPVSNRNRINFENEYIKKIPGFIGKNIHKQVDRDIYVYVSRYVSKENVGYNFSMEKFKDEELIFKLMSSKITWVNKDSLVRIHNYFIRNINGLSENIQSGLVLDTVLPLKPSDFNERYYDVEEMNSTVLNGFIDEEIKKGSDNIEKHKIELYKRFVYPFATIILTLLALAVSSQKLRGGIGMSIVIGIAICFTYIFAMQIAAIAAINSGVPPLLSVWIPNIIFGALTVYMYTKAPK